MRLRVLPTYVLFAAALTALPGCFLTDALPGPSKKGPTRGASSEEPPPKTEEILPPKILPPPQLVRRLALDLTGRLPPAADIEWLAADPTRYPALVDAYLSSGDAPRALAALHGRIWRLSPDRLPDLDAFVDDGDAVLGAALTPAIRRHLVEEPTLRLRHVLENGLPYSHVFTGNFTILRSDALTFWGLTSDGAPWPGEPFHFATYDDGRPAAGIVASNGLLASFPGRGDEQPRHRTSRILQALSCVTPEHENAHLFYDLTDDELGTDYTALARQRKPCAGCHGQFDQASAAFQGLGLATDFDDWKTYQTPDEDQSGLYAGQPFDDLQELAGFVGNDTRTWRCAVGRLGATLLQRPLDRDDAARAALAFNAFDADGESLFAAARSIVLDHEYQYAAVDGAVKGGSFAKTSSGVRVVSANQWRSLLAELSPATATIDVPDDLTPGHGEGYLTSDAAVPDAVYWQSLDRVARQAATTIIATELADGSIAATRRVLTELPDGAAANASAASATAQIRATWKRLTGATLADADPLLAGFVDLWTKAMAASDDDEGSRAAWRLVIIAMLTHPDFVTY